MSKYLPSMPGECVIFWETLPRRSNRPESGRIPVKAMQVFACSRMMTWMWKLFAIDLQRETLNMHFHCSHLKCEKIYIYFIYSANQQHSVAKLADAWIHNELYVSWFRTIALFLNKKHFWVLSFADVYSDGFEVQLGYSF